MRIWLRKAAAAGLTAAAMQAAGMSHWSALASTPRLALSGAGAPLPTDGGPLLMLAGELGNSGTGTAAQADVLRPRLTTQHSNTVHSNTVSAPDRVRLYGYPQR